MRVRNVFYKYAPKGFVFFGIILIFEEAWDKRYAGIESAYCRIA
jgi:hypothetical protein